MKDGHALEIPTKRLKKYKNLLCYRKVISGSQLQNNQLLLAIKLNQYGNTGSNFTRDI